jgi:hypothetical protein
MITNLDSHPTIRGALAFIEAVATEEQKQEAMKTDQGVGVASQQWFKLNVRRALAETVQATFKLNDYYGNGSPLAKEMIDFQIYFSEHSADALAAAWCRTKRGGLATDALNADYDFNYGGIYSLEDVDELVAEAKKLENGNTTWDRLRGYYREGDRVFYYRAGGSRGYVVLRGRRLVCDYESLHMQLSREGGAKMAGEVKAYRDAGGTEAVLAGKLVWPPPGWVNPVTDEEAKAIARREDLENTISK